MSDQAERQAELSQVKKEYIPPKLTLHQKLQKVTLGTVTPSKKEDKDPKSWDGFTPPGHTDSQNTTSAVYVKGGATYDSTGFIKRSDGTKIIDPSTGKPLRWK